MRTALRSLNRSRVPVPAPAALRLAALAWLMAAALAWPGIAGAQNTVRVVGVVRDEANAIRLPGVVVEVVGGSDVAYTDLDGRYRLDVAPGTQQIRIAIDGYQERTLRVDVPAGERSVTVDVGLSMARFAETIVVTGETTLAELATTEAQLLERRRSNVITDNVGSAEMKQNGDGDAAAAMQRVTGLSVVGNQYVFVRGLGERYSNTTLNGSVIPTTEPDRKVVPLDLFPSGLLSSVTVAKSYTPDRAADFAGGLVEVVPLKFPNEPVFDASWSLGFNSLTSGKGVIGYQGGTSDWRGFDDGTRSLPGAVPDKKVIRGGIYTPGVGVLRSELQSVGQSFTDNWDLTTRSARPNQSGSATFGQRVGRVGLLASYTQSYKEQATAERQVFYRASEQGLSSFSDYDFQYATRSANVGAVGNVAVQFTPNQRVTWENFYTHSGKNEARTFEGYNSDIATNIRNQRLFWAEEQLRTSGVTGEHFFSGMGNSRFDWRGTWSGATRDEPDLREVLYEQNGSDFVLSNQSQSGFRMFNGLADDTTDVAGNWSFLSTRNERPVQFKFGAQYVERTRDFSSRQFRFVPEDTDGLDLAAPPGQLFTQANIGAFFEIREQTRVTDAYSARQVTEAFYGMADMVLSSRTRLIAGARIEKFDQRVDTFDLFDFEGDPDVIRARIEKTELFPSVNFVYSPRPEQNLRLSFSQTVNRPEFRELAPFEFTDIVGGRAVVGNANLQRALIQNYDVRYEIFPGSEEVLAASFFLKHFENPIERIVEPTAQLRTSFTNAASARNAGLELEARKRAGDHVLIGGNYTFVNSNITLSPVAAQVQTSLERPLAGQSKNLVNVFGEVRGGRASLRLLYNFFGERISDVGSVGLPDIVESGRGTLDLVVSVRVLDRLSVRFTGDNLTDQAYTFEQGGLLQRRYTLGRTFAVNFGFSAF